MWIISIAFQLEKHLNYFSKLLIFTLILDCFSSLNLNIIIANDKHIALPNINGQITTIYENSSLVFFLADCKSTFELSNC